jgi:hypothetical protein
MSNVVTSILSRLTVVAATTPVTLRTVNQALRKAGITDELVKGAGYFYFVGEASNWPKCSVYVYRVNQLTIPQWIEEYRDLEKDGKR